MTHERSIALMRFLSGVARAHDVGRHAYIVGGAVRNYLLRLPIKDIDVVFDSVGASGRDSAWFAQAVQRAIPARANLTTNQYGVAILTVSESWVLDGHELDGEVIEVANARKESYGGDGGKGYKPHMVEPATIHEDLIRREFTFNTLLWRLGDLHAGPGGVEVLDLLGTGRFDLERQIMRTPADPDKTFSDDPTRMLRAVKFMARYGFELSPEAEASIRVNASKLADMPWDAVRKILVEDILEGPSPRISVARLEHLGLAQVLKGMLDAEKGFAMALSRSLAEQRPMLVLDLLELGWPIRHLLSTLPANQRGQIGHVLKESGPDFQQLFWGAFQKPQVDQVRLFDAFNIPPKERPVVNQIAREALLTDPSLARQPARLEAAVEAELRRRAPT